MVLLTNKEATARDASTVKAALANPTGLRPRRGLRKRVTAAITAAWFEFRRT